MQKVNHFKIIAGKFKGKTLDMPSLDTTRSSKAILRESYFNKLQFDIVNMPLVEMFAGSGSIGLEALSRGASDVYFLEKNREAFTVLQRNIRTLGADKNAHTFFGDSFGTIGEVLRQLKTKQQKAFFYADPPFSIRDAQEEIYIKTFKMLESLPQEVVEMITIEHMSGLELPKNIGVFHLDKTKKFGKSSLSYFLNSNSY